MSNFFDPHARPATNRDIERQTDVQRDLQKHTDMLEEQRYAGINTHFDSLEEAVNAGFEDMSNGLAELADITLWSTHEILLRLDQQSGLLERIVSALESPRATAVNERRRKGVERFHFGWFDEAIDEFQQCLEADGTDYVSHLFVGIVLFIKQEDQRSLEYLEKAARYAEPFSKSWVSFAWAIAAQIYTQRGEHEQALTSCNRAIQYDPESAVAYYQRARSLAASQQPSGISESLKKAIMLEAEHFTLSTTDPFLMPYQDTVQQVQVSLMSQLSREAQSQISSGEQTQLLAREFVGNSQLVAILNEQRAMLKKLRQSLNSETYILAGRLVKRLQILNVEAKKTALQAVDSEIASLRSQASSWSWRRNRISGSADMIAMVCACLAFALSILSWLWRFDLFLPIFTAIVWWIVGYGLGSVYDFVQYLRRKNNTRIRLQNLTRSQTRIKSISV